MDRKSGSLKPELNELLQIHDRITFIYLEHCTINREDSAVKVTDMDGDVLIPAAAIMVLLLGPGINITHRAVELIGDMGISIVWVGEHGVRYYAHGRALNSHTGLLLKQAEMVTNTRKHAEVVRKMYQMRFPNEDVSDLTIQQLRGREGSRIRSIYKASSEKWGVKWDGRDYDADNFDASDNVNKALSSGNACLYGLAYAVIVSLGCSAGLGFVHVGHECSFAYDIADLYKAEITIPIAFEMAAKEDTTKSSAFEFGGKVRRRIRDEMVKRKLLVRMVHDIKYLLEDENEVDGEDAVYLWDNKKGTVKNGIQYKEEE